MWLFLSGYLYIKLGRNISIISNVNSVSSLSVESAEIATPCLLNIFFLFFNDSSDFKSYTFKFPKN